MSLALKPHFSKTENSRETHGFPLVFLIDRLSEFIYLPFLYQGTELKSCVVWLLSFPEMHMNWLVASKLWELHLRWTF